MGKRDGGPVLSVFIDFPPPHGYEAISALFINYTSLANVGPRPHLNRRKDIHG